MNYTKSNKRKLLQGASALILGASATTAYAQSVTTTTNTIIPASVDTVKAQDQDNEANAIANANSNTYEAESLNNLTNSSVSLDGNGSEATARGNNATDTLTDAAAAEILTTNANTVRQDNSAQITANANNTDTYASGNDILGSTVDIYDNNNLALAQGNNAATTTTLTGYATNNTDSTMAAFQNNSTDNDILANANGNDVLLDLGTEVDGSRGTVSANSDRSAATGNSLTQQMTLGGTTLGLDTVSASANTVPTGDTGAGTKDVQASGAALISSWQINNNADVSAETSDSQMTIYAPVNIDGSALDLSSNVQDSTATGSSVGNAMTLSGTTVGTGAAIVSAQEATENTTVDAYTSAQAYIRTGTVGDDSGSAISLTDNKIQSRATGGSVTNTMAVSATTVTLQAQDGTQSVDIGSSARTSDTSLSGAVSGAFATLNDQLIDGDVRSTTLGAGAMAPGFYMDLDGAVYGSSINNDRNTLSSQAQAAVASNSTTLTVGGSLTESLKPASDVPTETIANGAVIANIQQVTDSAIVASSVDANNAVFSRVDMGTSDSTVTASSNKVQAFAEGATSTNVLTVSARTLNVADDSSGDAFTSAAPGVADADTAFAVANVQDSGTGSVSATLNDSVMIKTELVGDVDGSKVTSAGNMQDAFASSNKSTNALSLSATTLSGDAGVINNQVSASEVQAWIGGAGDSGGVFVPGELGANAGVIVNLGEDVFDSAVAVTGNMVRGSAISNSGTNSLTVAATTLSGDGNVGQALAFSTNTLTTADYGLGSYQNTESDGSSETNIASTFAIDQAFDLVLSGSSLSVSNNTQFGEALANTVTNRVSVASTDVGAAGIVPTTALNNNQYVDSATIDSTSKMTAYANAASVESSIALNGNSNTALSVANNASNIMSVTGVTVDGTVSDGDAYASLFGTQVIADYAINNTQQSLGVDEDDYADGAVNSTALTTIYNADINDGFVGGETGSTASAGLLNSSVTMSNNVTTAEASSNRALNSLSVSATNSAATAAVGNFQGSNNAVNAVASSTSIAMDLDVRGTTGDFGRNYDASGSTVTMANNSTTALARGNSASNALNYTVSASYDGVTSDAVNGGSNVAAAAAVFNTQENYGAINATASTVNYSVALNDDANGLAYGPINSSISMTGNAVNAVAFGNTATNSLTMSTFNAGIPSSINANVQFNTGSVTASASGAYVGVYSRQDVQGSAIRNSGNSASASAIGNNSVSTISGGN